MEESKQAKEPKEQPLEQVPAEHSAQIAGGDGECTSTVTLSGNPSIVTTGATPGDALISAYEGVVDATSHIIERVANAIDGT